jgi:predicted SnoaL-like aldol condensation-catalyzing enzyme
MKLSNTKQLNIIAAALLSALLAACSVTTPLISSATPNNSDISTEEANKRFALAFYRPGITTEERDAMIHPDYVQHNPAALKFADAQGIDAKEAFPLWMAVIAAGGAERPEPTGPRAPAGQQAYMAIAEGDKVFLMHRNFGQDPNEPAGTFYEYFSWGMFDFKDGLIYEHWDGNIISPE